ncbi:MAG: peptidoglycan DD-metalloendopeptidase family protein [Gammaproteobacteria bacterium]|nr:peptidoglycan DD-metalloendopeptidase family protein [Gammaproteobacteria bacterium]
MSRPAWRSRTPFKRAAALALALLAGGCVQPGQPPIIERSPALGTVPDAYVVRSGDTLYAIAWRFGFDYRALARANDIDAPYTIFQGQRIRLAAAPAARAPQSASAAPAESAEPPASRQTAPAGAWQAPTDAPVQRGYGDGNRGIDYRLSAGHRVRSTAAGEVVYAGSGLGGYRHLIIVKHDPRYLSAYSLNRPMAVREGQHIKAGGQLADNESGERREETLHFEIRKDGEPVNPATLLDAGG